MISGLCFICFKVKLGPFTGGSPASEDVEYIQVGSGDKLGHLGVSELAV
jgi:hypothetical protein